MLVDLFDFELPPDLIATRPVRPRDAARLLTCLDAGDGGTEFGHAGIRDLPRLLRRGDLLVFNDTRVIAARLTASRRRGDTVAQVEVTLLRPLEDGSWEGLARPAKRLRPGDLLQVDGTVALSARVVDTEAGGRVRFAFDREGADLEAAIAADGAMPLPPYIAGRRPADAQDREDYQTVFARRRGAVAAPTAGLHFTDRLIGELRAAGIDHGFVTLHVGAGTFQPVRAADTADHRMHAEWGEVTEAMAVRIAQARAAGGRIVAVGTTALRLLESAAQPDGAVAPFSDETDIFITPGYRFRAVDLLLTNFHLPRSTLMMLVAAFIGLERCMALYREAIGQGYRFYSYGDASLLQRREPVQP